MGLALQGKVIDLEFIQRRGLDLSLDYPKLDPKHDLSWGENHAFWFFDDKGKFSMCNHIQGGGTQPAGQVCNVAEEQSVYQQFPDWRTRRMMYSIADSASDKLLVDYVVAPCTVPDGFVDLGGWSFRCVEPFVHWKATYRGRPRLVSRAESAAGVIDMQNGERVGLEVDLYFYMALPPTFKGTDHIDEDVTDKSIGMRMTGTPRYEQLYRVIGAIRVEGRPEYKFTGTGLRTHRTGKRAIPGIFSWSWHSALFPSGRGFLAGGRYRNPEGQVFYCEGWAAYEDGTQIRAKVKDTPMLERFDYTGMKFDVHLIGSKGPTVIHGEVLDSHYNYGAGIDRNSPDASITSLQHMARYVWDGEETTGLMELGSYMGHMRSLGA